MAHCDLPWKFHANPFGSFRTKLLTNRQTDRQTNNNKNITSFMEVIIQKYQDTKNTKKHKNNIK